MVRKEEYKSLAHTLNAIRVQVRDSLDYSKERFDGYDTPSDLFYYLQSVTTFYEDPPGVELLQSAPSLFNKNRHGIPGAGDCDCFTILSLSCLIINRFGPQSIFLTGRTPDYPVHIFAGVGKTPFDLTYSAYGHHRKYQYIQRLPFKI